MAAAVARARSRDTAGAKGERPASRAAGTGGAEVGTPSGRARVGSEPAVVTRGAGCCASARERPRAGGSATAWPRPALSLAPPLAETGCSDRSRRTRGSAPAATAARACTGGVSATASPACAAAGADACARRLVAGAPGEIAPAARPSPRMVPDPTRAPAGDAAGVSCSRGGDGAPTAGTRGLSVRPAPLLASGGAASSSAVVTSGAAPGAATAGRAAASSPPPASVTRGAGPATETGAAGRAVAAPAVAAPARSGPSPVSAVGRAGATGWVAGVAGAGGAGGGAVTRGGNRVNGSR